MIKKLIVCIVSLLLVCCSFTAAQAIEEDYSESVFTYEMTLSDWQGNVCSPSDFMEDTVILIFGRQACGNTMSVLKFAENLVNDGYSVKPVLLLLDDYHEPQPVSEFAEYHPLTFVSDAYDANSDLVDELKSLAGVEGCFLPFVFLMDKDRNIYFSSTGSGSFERLGYLITGEDIDFCHQGTSTTIVHLPLDTAVRQTESRTMLDMINEFRTGSDAWVWNEDSSEKVYIEGLGTLTYDYELERIAMARAKEIVISFSHLRPDGRLWSTAYTEAFKYADKAENISYGQATAQEVFSYWKNEESDYVGQKQRRNMLDEKFTSVGIACLELQGIRFWVQEFSSVIADTEPVEYDEEPVNQIADVSPETVDLRLVFDKPYSEDPNVTMTAGTSMDVPFCLEFLYFLDQYAAYLGMPSDIRSSDESVLKIEDNKLYAVSIGEADLIYTASFANQTVQETLKFTVNDHVHDYQLDHWNWKDDYSGAEAIFVCSADSSHTVKVRANISSRKMTPTCYREGLQEYTATAVFEGNTYTDTISFVLEKLDHVYGTPVYTWAEDNSTVTASVSCLSCTNELTEEVSTTYEVIEEPTEEETGTGRYTAEFSSSLFEMQTKDVVIPKLSDGMPKSVSLDHTNLSLIYNSSVKLSATVEPSDAEDKTVTWSSADESIAAVDQDGRVKGVKPGLTEVTATTVNGLSASCTVRVLFTDVSKPDQYFYEPVYWAVDHGITVGAGGAGKFSPNNPCTREQIVTFLWRLMDEPEPETQSDFTDVPESAWYYKPITWAYENGITTGLNDGTGRFGVGQPCTREQCVTFLYRAAEEPPVTSHESFTDVAEGRYYYDAISWAASKKITVGLNDGTGRFGVGQKCTRAMIVTFLSRYAHISG